MAFSTTSCAPGLASLVTPTTSAQFMAEFWRRKCLFVERSFADVGGLPHDLARRSVKDLLRVARSPVLVMHTSARGEYKGTNVAAPEALDFYDSNLSLYFDLVESCPDVSRWARALADEVGQKAADVRISIFAC